MELNSQLSWSYKASYHGVIQPVIMEFCSQLSWSYKSSYHGVIQPANMEFYCQLSWSYTASYHGVINPSTLPACEIPMFDKVNENINSSIERCQKMRNIGCIF